MPRRTLLGGELGTRGEVAWGYNNKRGKNLERRTVLDILVTSEAGDRSKDTR
jgi:hypothetical protein